MAPLGLNIEDRVWETFFRVKASGFLTRFMDTNSCCYYLLFTVIADRAFWRCFRGEEGVGEFFSSFPCSDSAEKYKKKEAILLSFCWCFSVDLMDDLRDTFPLKNTLKRLFLYLLLFITTATTTITITIVIIDFITMRLSIYIFI